MVTNEEALQAYEGVLAPFEGEFSTDKWGRHFKGKNCKGEWFDINFSTLDEGYSVGADMYERGIGCPCNTLQGIILNTENAIKYANPKRKKQEQLKLW